MDIYQLLNSEGQYWFIKKVWKLFVDTLLYVINTRRLLLLPRTQESLISSY